jgi:hypothetical protein
MIISDLSYLEVVSEVPSIVGGRRKRTNETTVKLKVSIKIKGDNNSVAVTQNSSVVTSNDNLS